MLPVMKDGLQEKIRAWSVKSCSANGTVPNWAVGACWGWTVQSRYTRANPKSSVAGCPWVKCTQISSVDRMSGTKGGRFVRREDAPQMASLRKNPASLRSGSLPSKRDDRWAPRRANAHSTRELHGQRGDPTPSIPGRMLAWRQAESPTQGLAHEWFTL